MATRKTTRKRRRTSSRSKKQQHPLARNLTLLISAILGVLGTFKLGLIGIFVANIFRFFFGNVYFAIIVPLTVGMLYYMLMRKLPKIAGHFWMGAGMAFIAIEVISSLLFFTYTLQDGTGYVNEVIRIIKQDFANQAANTPLGGGVVGAAIYHVLFMLMSNVGTWIVTTLLLFAGVIIFFRIPARDIAEKSVEKAQAGVAYIQEQRANAPKREPFFNKNGRKKDITDYGDNPLGVDHSAASEMDNQAEKVTDELPQNHEFIEPEIKWNGPVTNNENKSSDEVVTPATTLSEADEEVSLATDTPEANNPDYQLPSAELLTQVPPADQTKEFKSLTEKSRLVHDTLQSFGVEAEVTSVSLGPTVTQYELKPGQGVKVNRIANLADDLALALAAKSIRIEAPIPGKPYVGIEVPNDTQATVGFRDMIEHAPFDDNPLNVPLGRDVTGNIIMADLSAMPHLLIAGSTGSGKSVGLNGIIISILLRAKPSEVKLMMVDPKVVELSIYNGIPHLLTPVVSEPRKAAKSLQKVVDEMENRYKLLAQFGKRNIGEYNAAVDKQNAGAIATGEPIMQKMPYIVAIVDEFADLMSTVGSEIEVSIARLGAKARAAGIHMILATQRPDVKVVNGTIKSNIPGRIAFRTASGIDSRTILDSNGAEKLLGRGDMIFAPPGKPTQRVQGAFISNADVTSVVEFVKAQQEVQYSEAMTVTDEEVAQDGSDISDGNSEDELFQDALQFVIEQQKASTSLLQRRFRIGYNRAARLIDDLEASGYIGPADGSRPRHVNVSDGSSGIEQ
ncbi:FtsK/SpoIIIE family DNA translocase [Leuconostoc falkenbergense]|uniref:FtsK/SpoIIIE family DNA translocase n=1 Tax=Leuconostoc falkenbergense TaxID=2766470 RepID=UPI00027382F9|nr:DNA translocase FtsK [Leuconostoc falkenbergense]OQJ68730.1 cell division protein FtsK [Leuconostoc pseudomesenteroides]CCJ67274.1 Cell division protein FtsK [Leuconostoc pseudomesenteroides 4882]MCT4420001.1 cell division protein FtsK [Leuconostoc falkenbergense]OQJ71630.1 cell division protein FtsK [Leuconostoc pseudomesenteroides]OQJ81691.1 cell division protein FtsK [Leuconostoc pseudomesenteroides]